MGSYPFIGAALLSSAALTWGVWLQGCASDAAASARDSAVADVGPGAGSDRAGDVDGSLCDSARDVEVRVSFQLPSKTFSFDAQAWMISPGNSVATPCGGPATVTDCCNPPAPMAPPDCASTPLVCAAGLCTVQINVTVAQGMDLKSEVPALSNLDQAVLCEVSLERLRFTATSTLNVSLESLQLYLAPGAIRDPGAASAQAFGTIPAIPAGASMNGDIIRLPATDRLFANYARMFGTPFTLMISTAVSVPSGSPPPSGTLTVTISGDASATL